jgi:hypothetical protein
MGRDSLLHTLLFAREAQHKLPKVHCVAEYVMLAVLGTLVALFYCVSYQGAAPFLMRCVALLSL